MIPNAGGLQDLSVGGWEQGTGNGEQGLRHLSGGFYKGTL